MRDLRRLVLVFAALAMASGCSPSLPTSATFGETAPQVQGDLEGQTAEALRAVPEEQRPAMERYLEGAALPNSSTGFMEFTRLSDSWQAMGRDPQVKERLVEIAQRRGYDAQDVVWFQYSDPTSPSPEGESAQLLHYDSQADRWDLAATRSGPYPANVVEVE